MQPMTRRLLFAEDLDIHEYMGVRMCGHWGKGNSDTRGILQRLVREDEKEMEEEGNSDSDISVSSDLGPIFNVIL